MALNDAAVLLPGRGTVFFGDVGTTVPDYHLIDPTDPTTYTGFTCLGHTSRENTVSLTKDGGDATQKGTWWSPNFRNTYEAVVWGATVNALQIDTDTFDLAYNGYLDTTDTVNGGYVVPEGAKPNEVAIFILMMDGTTRAGLDYPKCSVTVGDPPSIDVENFFETQLALTTAGHDGRLFRFLHPNFDPTP